MPTDRVTLALTGDVMLGRGVDQVLAHPVDPTLHEPWMTDARAYVELAEHAHGPVPHPVPDAWPWGDALDVLEGIAPDVRVLNLETSVTHSEDVDRSKAVHYRMAPENVGALAAARPDVCVLANNHVLDFGPSGLDDTLDTLRGHGLLTAGAGRDRRAAEATAAVPLPGGRRLLVAAVGTPSAGVPDAWAATDRRSGIAVVERPCRATGEALGARLADHRGPGDLLLVSVHWGSNWGHAIPDDHTRFAHALLDAGVDVVHGHSSHHPRAIEVHDGRLVLYGCGDLVNDYEGIAGHDRHRPDLRLLYLATLDAASGRLVELRMPAFRARRLRLEVAAPDETAWLGEVLDGVGHAFDTPVEVAGDELVVLP